MKGKMAAGLLVFVSPAVALTDEMPMVGLDQNHHSVVQWVSKTAYLSQMQEALSGVHQSVNSVLEQKSLEQAGASCALPGSSSWKLRSIAVGVNVNFTAGLGFLGSATFNPRLRLVYSRGQSRIFPD